MSARSLLLAPALRRRLAAAAPYGAAELLVPARALLQQANQAHDAADLLHAPARELLQANQAPPVGGFQAAKYFTYVFFALAIAVVLVMIFLCTIHCYRRARRARDVEMRRMQPAAAMPEVNIQIEPTRDPVPLPKPLTIFAAVLVQHPDGSKEVAYNPNSPAQVLQPELTAAQKASERLLRSRSSRIASVPRFDEADPRARRRRQLASDAAVGRHLPPGGLRRGDRERRGGRDRDGAAAEIGLSSSLRGERREREGGSSNGGGGGPTLERHRSDGMTAERLAASSSGRVQPFFLDRERAGSATGFGMPLASAELGSSNSDSEWGRGGGARLHPCGSAGSGSGRQHRRHHRSSGGGGGRSSSRRHHHRRSDSAPFAG